MLEKYTFIYNVYVYIPYIYLSIRILAYSCIYFLGCCLMNHCFFSHYLIWYQMQGNDLAAFSSDFNPDCCRSKNLPISSTLCCLFADLFFFARLPSELSQIPICLIFIRSMPTSLVLSTSPNYILRPPARRPATTTHWLSLHLT